MMATLAETVMCFLSSVKEILGHYIKTGIEYCDPYLCQLIHKYSAIECYKICSLKNTTYDSPTKHDEAGMDTGGVERRAVQSSEYPT
jgi:hypothetical protein